MASAQSPIPRFGGGGSEGAPLAFRSGALRSRRQRRESIRNSSLSILHPDPGLPSCVARPRGHAERTTAWHRSGP
jgi:hypothetical protein